MISDPIYVYVIGASNRATDDIERVRRIRRYLLSGDPSSWINSKMTAAIDVRDWFLIPSLSRRRL